MLKDILKGNLHTKKHSNNNVRVLFEYPNF